MATTGSGTSSASTSQSGSYTLAQLISRWRMRLDDTESPYLWSNDELTEYVDTLQKHLVAEMNILEDMEDDDDSIISLVQGDGLITLPMERILKIKKARIDGEYQLLEIRNADYMDSLYGDWRGIDTTVEQGVPTIIVTEGVGTDKAYLYPPLLAATGTLKLHVQRVPLLDLDYDDNANDYLEIDKYCHLIIHGILQQAYLKQDSDVYDPRRSEQHRVLWEGQNGMGGDKERIRRMVMRQRINTGFAYPLRAFS